VEAWGVKIMSNELMIVLAAASMASLAGGALVAWVTARQYPGTGPEEEGRRELELLELREAAGQSRRESQAAGQHARARDAELAEAQAHIHTLEDQAAAYLRQYAQAKNMLKAEIRQKTQLQTELAAAGARIESLQARVQEMEMERNAITGSLRRLSA